MSRQGASKILRCSAGAFALAAIMLAGPGCGVNTPSPPVGRTVSLTADIQPIFTANCIRCHRVGGTAYNGFPLIFPRIPMLLTEGDAYASLVNVPSRLNGNRVLVVPGDSENSALFGKVSRFPPPVGHFRMPLGKGPLSSEDLGLIRDWIDQGAEDN